MNNNRVGYLTALLATTILAGGGAWAASAPASAPDQKVAAISPSTSTADKDFGKLSVDGASALNDVALTRLAIFDGRVDDAKKFVGQADAAFTKAKTDDTAFTKAETDLKPLADAKTKPTEPESAEQMKTPVAWLPIDRSVAIDEDYIQSPEKKAAVADADKSLTAGNRKAAMDKLKLADVKIEVTLAVVPLDKTMGKVKAASDLINEGKYYEASQDLRQVQDGERFYTVGDSGTPKE
jgi:hypothetical protein